MIRNPSDPYNQGQTPNALDPYGTRAPMPWPPALPTQGAATTDPYAGATGAGASPTVRPARATDNPQNPLVQPPAAVTPPPTGVPPGAAPGTNPTTGASFLAQPGLANGGGWGGGWDAPWASGLPHALQSAIANGLTGQAAIEWIASTYPELASQAAQIQYYAQNGQYGLPGNMYVAPNPQNGGALDLIQRQPGDTGTSTDSNATATNDPTLLRRALLDRLTQLGQPIDPTSPAIAQPMAAYNLQADRGSARTNQALAEAAYAKGSLNTGGYGQAQQQALEQTAADKAAFSGNLVSQADQQRQAALNQLLGLGSAQGTQQLIAGGQLGLGYSQLQEQANRDALIAALTGG